MKSEVAARDLRVVLLEDAVRNLSNLCAQSQQAYYVLLHELARQLFQTADHLKIDTSELQPVKPEENFNSNKLGPWFETLYILSRRVKEEIVLRKQNGVVRVGTAAKPGEINNNESLEERLLHIMSKLQNNLSVSRPT